MEMHCNNNKGNGQINFLSKAVRERCSDCVCLVQGEERQWVCDEMQLDCMNAIICPEGLELKI